MQLWTLASGTGASVEILNYGGIVRVLRVPDRNGRMADVVLGFDRLEPYLKRHPYFGAIIGRIAGRVSGGRLVIEGHEYLLARNDRGNHLHGGRVGLDQRLWQATPVSRPDGADSLRLTYRSPDGEEGYPATLDLAVTYTFTADQALIVETETKADRPTPACLAHHSYFNLGGEGSGSVADHEIQIVADACVPTDAAMTLSGRRESVAGSARDFRRPRLLGPVLPQLFEAHGDFYLLRAPAATAPAQPVFAARVVHATSGRTLDVSTNNPCLQFYTGSALDGTLTGKSGRVYGPHAGLCLECQGYPDGTSKPEFSDILVRPNFPQRRCTRYAFSTL